MSKIVPAQAWGKCDLESGERHHLAHHSADVAAVLLALIDVPIFRRRLEAAAGQPLSSDQIECLAALAFLHDAGKIAPGFQVKAWTTPHSLPVTDHLTAGWQWLGRTQSSDLVPLQSWSGMADWFTVLFAHHGRPVPDSVGSRMRGFDPLPGYDWLAQEKVLTGALRRWFRAVSHAAPPAPMPALAHFFAGLLALADWIGSDRAAFPFVKDFDPDYWARAHDQARRHVASIGLAGRRSLSGSPAWSLILPDSRPRPAQEAVAEVPVTERLVILEAETGAGKTEAALWRFARLYAAGEADALYFAVPTRAAARQLQGRIDEIVGRIFGPDAPEAILAIPGQLRAGEADGQRLPGFEVRWDDGVAGATRWAAEHATRFLAAEIAVGTVDQVMMAGLKVKHAHLRGSALSRAFLVVDEVHASDDYMTEHLRRTVFAHVALGGHAMLMSATLGSRVRTEWLGHELPSADAAAAIPYPAVWTRSYRLGIAAEPSAGKAVNISANAGWSGADAARIATDAAREGARVLVIRNTVARARETWDAVCAEAPDLVFALNGVPTLHHSRFAAEDRARLDARVEDCFGKKRGGGGMILIGTQTLEQSLDIDADFLVTDLCPMDVLLQRIGRLHRHASRDRPAGFEKATAHVLTPPGDLAELIERHENGLGALEVDGRLGGVYPDVPMLAATLDQIAAQTVWLIPSMNRALVEAATHPDRLETLARARGWGAYRNRLEGKALAERVIARGASLDRSAPFPDSFPNDETIRTRLGEMGPVLKIEGAPVGPFGHPLRRMALPAHWARGLAGDESLEVTGESPLRMTIEEREFVYDAGGLRKRLHL